MNSYYIDNLGKINKIRYIDTSSIMNFERLAKFIFKAKDSLIKYNIKIIVIKDVYEELLRHISYEDDVKKELAEKGLTLIESNLDIFEIEDTNADDNFAKAFADRELMTRMMANRTSRSQMLITNDRNLAEDASMLNKIKSVAGGCTYVCYIDRSGELQKADTETPIENVELTDIDEMYTLKKTNKIAIYLEYGFVAISSFFIGRYNKEIVNTINKTIKKISNNIKK